MLIVPSRSGRLGNRLQLAAYVAAVAIEHETTAALLCLGRYRRWFAGSASDALCQFPRQRASWWVTLGRRVLAVLAHLPGFPALSARRSPGRVLDEPGVLARIGPRAIALRGYYFYAPALLRKHAAAIRGYFQLVPSLAGRVAAYLARSRQRGERLVGVHVRHGDYATYRDGEHYFTTEQYAHLMRQTRDALAPARVHFIVCSDTPQPDGAFAGLSWERGPGNTVDDLYALAGCDYVLGPCSTFNRWSAFVGNVPRYEIRDVGRPLSLADFTPPADLTVPDEGRG